MTAPASTPAPHADELEALLRQALAEHGVHLGFLDTVRRLLFDEDAGWRQCCGSACDPCVQKFSAVVDQVREAIGWRPGQPDPSAE